MENKEIGTLLVAATIDRLKRSRTRACQEFLNIHHQISMERNFIKSKFKDILALDSNLPEIFLRINVPRQRRRIHRHERIDNFSRLLKQQLNPNDIYYEYFRMSEGAFNSLCKKLAPYLRPSTACTYVTAPCPIWKQVALCLYKLSSCADYRIVGEMFGVHKSTVHKYFHIVIKAILCLRKEFIKFPDSKEAICIARAFEQLTNLPNILGVIDATHIPITPPNDVDNEHYINEHGWPSIIMQSVVDNNGLFRDVCVKHSGSTKKVDAFVKSELYKNSRQLFPIQNIDVDGMQIPLMLIGDSAYPLMPWLLNPFEAATDAEDIFFNRSISCACVVAENALARLKGRWKCLNKKMDVNASFIPNVILACLILHNFLELEKQEFPESWLPENTFSNSHDSIGYDDATTKEDAMKNGMQIRHILKMYLKKKNIE